MESYKPSYGYYTELDDGWSSTMTNLKGFPPNAHTVYTGHRSRSGISWQYPKLPAILPSQLVPLPVGDIHTRDDDSTLVLVWTACLSSHVQRTPCARLCSYSRHGRRCYIYRAYGSDDDDVWQNMNQTNQPTNQHMYVQSIAAAATIKVTFLDIFPRCDQNSLSEPSCFSDTPATRPRQSVYSEL